jgi:AcrR family transcriptional regulator
VAQVGMIQTAAMAKKIDTSATLLAAAKKVLRKGGYSALSTRDVATAAGVPLSQIHYHFGSKDGMMLALFEYLNDELLHRQQAMFGNPALKLSEQWDLACTYLDEDLASGYVRVLQELWAAGYSNPQIAKVVRAGILRWQDLLTLTARKAEERFGSFAGLAPEDVAALVGAAFIGGEAYILLGAETRELPVRKALRSVGELIRKLEKGQSQR